VFPWAEVQLAFCNSYYDLTSHDLAFHVGVGIVFVSVMAVLGVWFLGGEFLQPYFVIMMQTRFIIIDEYRSSDMHRVNEHQAVFNAAFCNKSLNFIMY
jgi:hypothetical protein